MRGTPPGPVGVVQPLGLITKMLSRCAAGRRQRPSESVRTTSRPFDTMTPDRPGSLGIRRPLPRRSWKTCPAATTGAATLKPPVNANTEAAPAAMISRRFGRPWRPRCIVPPGKIQHGESRARLGRRHDARVTSRCALHDNAAAVGRAASCHIGFTLLLYSGPKQSAFADGPRSSGVAAVRVGFAVPERTLGAADVEWNGSAQREFPSDRHS